MSMIKKIYYVIHFKQINGLRISSMDFDKSIRNIKYVANSYIGVDYEGNVVTIIPVDNVLYIQKLEEDF